LSASKLLEYFNLFHSQIKHLNISFTLIQIDLDIFT